MKTKDFFVSMTIIWVLYKSEWVNLRKKTKKSSKKYDDSKGFVCEGLNGRKALVHS